MPPLRPAVSRAATTCAIRGAIYSYIPLVRAAGPVGRVRGNTCTSRRTRSCTRSTRRCRAARGDVQPARRRLPLGRRDAATRGPATPWSMLGPGQRGLASVIACREVGAGTIIVTGLAADANKLALARDVRRGPHRSTSRTRTQSHASRDHGRTRRRHRRRRLGLRNEAGGRRTVDGAPGGTVVLAGVKGFKPVEFRLGPDRDEGDQHRARSA